MVSGVFNSDGTQGRSNAANDRLTVLLCFQDDVRLYFAIWEWGVSDRSGSPDTESIASYQYTSLRNRVLYNSQYSRLIFSLSRH